MIGRSATGTFRLPCTVPAVSAQIRTGQPQALSSSKCGRIAAISSSTERVRRSPLCQPETSCSPYLATAACTAAASLGNLPPFSMPLNPASAASRRQVSSGVSPPSSGMSSLLQAIGLVPIRTVPIGPLPLTRRLRGPRLLVALARLAHLRPLRDLGHRHVPPGAARLGRRHRVGIDHHHIGPLGRLGTLKRQLEVANAADLLRDCPHAARVRREV